MAYNDKNLNNEEEFKESIINNEEDYNGEDGYLEEYDEPEIQENLEPVLTLTDVEDITHPEEELIKPQFWSDWKLKEPEFKNADWVIGICPKCSAKTKTKTLFTHKSGHFHCEACSFRGNATVKPKHYREKNLNFDLQWWKTENKQRAFDWFFKQGILKETIEQVDISFFNMYFPQTNNYQLSLAMPCRRSKDEPIKDVIYQAISVDGLLNLQKNSIGGTVIPWGWDDLDNECAILVNNPLDRLAYIQAGYSSVACLPEGLDPQSPDHKNWDFLLHVEEKINAVERFILSFEDNEAGYALENEIGRRFGKEKCFRVRWQDQLEESDRPVSAIRILKEIGSMALQDAIEDPSPFPVNGVYELSDVEDRFEALYEFGMPGGATTGWPSLDSHYTVAPGQWTLVTGIPGHGKSSFLDALLINLAKLHDWKIGLFSPENQPIERHYAGLIEKASGKPFNAKKGNKISPDEKDMWKAWVNKHFKIILPDDDASSWSVDGVLSLAKVLVFRYGIKGLVLDPWNELEHSRPAFMSETEHISAALTKIRRFAKNYGVHIWIVAHPTKLEPRADGKYPVPTPYSVAGGAHWRNKADNSITVYRNVGEEDDDISDIHIQKIRFKEIGQVGMISLRGDRLSGQYYDDIDQEKRKQSIASGKVLSSTELRTQLRKPNTGISLEEINSAEEMFKL